MDASCTAREVVDLDAGYVDVVIEDGAVGLVERARPSQRIYHAASPAPIGCR
jgi:hypothetical protein